MRDASGEIFIADDDHGVRDAVYFAARHAGWIARTFADGASLLAATCNQTPACILLDVNMPGMSGLEILKRLREQRCEAPIFMISGVGDIPTAVEAIRTGAVDFIQKPFKADELIRQLAPAVERSRAPQHRGAGPLPSRFRGRELLTPRETEVLTEVVSGASTKEVGRTLGVSPRTVEVHRSNILQKLGARNSMELMRIVLGAPWPAPPA
jgi:FixJ family two-component response regulator